MLEPRLDGGGDGAAATAAARKLEFKSDSFASTNPFVTRDRMVEIIFFPHDLHSSVDGELFEIESSCRISTK